MAGYDFYVTTFMGGSIPSADFARLASRAQEQSVLGLAPVFGDEPETERIAAQNGVLYEINEGVGTYMVQLSVQFMRKYEVKNPWLT